MVREVCPVCVPNFVGNGSESGNKPTMGAAGPSLPSLPQRPAVRKSAAAAATALDTAGRITQRPAVTPSTQLATTTDDTANGETAEGNETREKLQNIRVKFLRLAHRLGQSPQNVVVAQVLYRLGLAESLRGGSASTASRTGAFSFDRANALAEEQEAANQEEELDFACTILVLGKTGVGKSATINSIFDDRKSATSAFKPSTTKVQEIVGTVHGIKVCQDYSVCMNLGRAIQPQGLYFSHVLYRFNLVSCFYRPSNRTRFLGLS